MWQESGGRQHDKTCQLGCEEPSHVCDDELGENDAVMCGIFNCPDGLFPETRELLSVLEANRPVRLRARCARDSTWARG
ncbi:hypothetical protein PG985_004826 [Apiospora marii]|uniref:uncharacterized protein n=1 Tax=Apiospora marii TaxID=335849 RepID=UPI003130119F